MNDSLSWSHLINSGVIISLLIGSVIPFITALVTKQTWTGGLKFLVTTILAGITGFLSQWGETIVANTPFDYRQALVAMVLTIVTAEVAYVRGWKKSNVIVQAQLSAVADVAPAEETEFYDPPPLGQHAA